MTQLPVLIDPYVNWKGDNTIWGATAWHSTPTNFTGSTSSSTIAQNVAFTSIKYFSGTGYTYALAWATQLHTKVAPTANIVN